MSDQKPRNVYLVHWGRTGAGPLFLRELTSAFVARGDRTAVSYNVDAEGADRFPSGARSLPVRTYRSAMGAVLTLPRSALNAWRLYRDLKGVRDPVVIGTMEHLHQSLMIPVVARRGGTYVSIIHDVKLHSGDANILRRFNRWVELRFADVVVTLSNADELPPRQGQRVLQSVHPAFGSPAADAEREARNPGAPVRVGFFGRLVPYKGLELIPEIGRLLAEALPSEPIRVHGSGPLAGASYLVDSPHVDLDARWIPEDEVPTLVSRLDVVVLPYTEASQSGVIALAMGLGVPCVVTPVGGLIQQAKETGAARVARDVTAEAVTEALVEVLTDPELYAGLIESGLASAANEYSWGRLADDILGSVDENSASPGGARG
ncbi:glycosyltransferase family 4 protein [Cellulomonas palmilytica]|uniref:glycosyltransferase family 4 protein n=1 Tax=Cellulomonas palmilytica TaxID=2608402 RepID=UPI001F448C0C|nr:glycosyltransferase [Cellulomonas palmilytica]UJP41011.1 glycosyltransferase [Cellulomonas palmilytica]